MLILIHGIGVEMMAWSLFYDDPSVEPLWGHSARPTIHLMPCWGIFPFWMRFADLHGVAIPTCGVCAETMTFSLFYDDPSVESLIQVCISRHRVVFILSILRDVPWMFRFDLDHWDHMPDDRWLCITGFPTYRIFDATLGHLSISDEVWRSPKSYMIVPTYGVRAETMICLLLLWWFLTGASRESSS